MISSYSASRSPADPLQPGGEALVQRGPVPLGQRRRRRRRGGAGGGSGRRRRRRSAERSGRISSLRTSAKQVGADVGPRSARATARPPPRGRTPCRPRCARSRTARSSVAEPVEAGGQQGLDGRRDRHRGQVAGGRPSGRSTGPAARRRPAWRPAPRRTAGCPRRPAVIAGPDARRRPRPGRAGCRSARRAVALGPAARAGSRWRWACRRPSRHGRRAARAGRGSTAAAARRGTSRRRGSIRSSRVGSAQCRSSSTTTSGRWRASASSSLRTAQGAPRPARAVAGQAEQPGHPAGHEHAPWSSPCEQRDQLGRAVLRRRRHRRSRPPARTISATGQKVMPSP